MTTHAPGVVQALQENGVPKLVAMKQTLPFGEIMRSYECFPLVNKNWSTEMLTLMLNTHWNKLY
jgi:hypothetical protein